MTDKNNEQKEILLNESLVAKQEKLKQDDTLSPQDKAKDSLVETEAETVEEPIDATIEETVEEQPEIVETEILPEEVDLSEPLEEVQEDLTKTAEFEVDDSLDKTLEMAPPRENPVKPEEPMKNKKKNKRHWSTYVFVVIGVLVLIPSLIVTAIVIQAAMGQGKPAEGERFSGDLDPAITSDQMKTIETSISALPLAEKVEVHMISATMRVNVKTAETIKAEEFAKLMQDLYNNVITVLPKDKYFQVQPAAGRHQYDLEINAYNLDPSAVKADKDGELKGKYIYFSLVKSSLMEEVKIQEVSVPIDATQAELLRKRVKDREDWIKENENQKPSETEGSSEGEGA